ncbi:MAG: hypothetical protein COT84_05365 [Chlamydiae bacterium CG10_big_fil_rev_8_21_14_0_10_35_9]|nr:MAG: hypothetical protein COT84_05365 [Chlamydiae bacterium CG10_big_fil_rev_8_21_14_0_10_35_9]
MIRVFLLFILFFCSACENKPLTHFKGWAMTMPYRIVIGKKLTKKEQNKVLNIIYDSFKEVDLIYNNWNPTSEISLFNNSETTEWIEISPKLSRFLEKCHDYVKLSQNRFDPTIGSIFADWQQSLQKRQVLEKAHAQDSVGWNTIEIKKNALRKTHKLCKLDFCALSKGYAVDLIMEKLRENGFHNMFVEWGGEIKCSGTHPQEREWLIEIQSPEKEGLPEDFKYIHLKDQAIATSGNFMMYEWKVKEESFFHIFNPLKKRPVKKTENGPTSVTVIAPDCITADALATACMTFEELTDAITWAEKIVEKNPNITFYMVNPKQKVFKKIL